MAAPIAHIFLAIQVLACPLENKFTEREFLIGTSFPDIRYLGVIDRKLTHVKNISFDQVQNQTNSFFAGLLFHSLVDELRQKYLENDLLQFVTDFKFKGQLIKFAEDKILAEAFDTAKYAAHFNHIAQEELIWQIPESQISKWHNIIKSYLLSKEVPINLIINKALSFLGPILNKVFDMQVSSLTKNQNFRDKVLNFYCNFLNYL